MNKLWMIILLFCGLSCTRQLPQKTFQLPAALHEVSGLYIENSNSFWWHNDGGNAPELYQTNGGGHVLNILSLKSIVNKDWEDLSHDDKGNIYIGDFGNNSNRRKDLQIYKYDILSNKMDSIPFQYPDQQLFPPKSSEANFDAEAFFWYQDSLHIFSKNRLITGNYMMKHYSVSDTISDVQTAILRGDTFLKKRVVTAAAISSDGKTIALLAYFYKKILGIIPYSAASIFLIKNFEGTDFLEGEIYKKRMPNALLAKQFEAIDFLNKKTLYVASEQTLFFAPRAKRIKLKAKDFKKRKLQKKR